MLRAALKSLLVRKLRLLMSTFAIVLGVAFVAGTLVFSDTLSRSFTALFASTVGDVVVQPEGGQTALELESGVLRVDTGDAQQVCSLDGHTVVSTRGFRHRRLRPSAGTAGTTRSVAARDRPAPRRGPAPGFRSAGTVDQRAPPPSATPPSVDPPS